jgi:hypothetical protein
MKYSKMYKMLLSMTLYAVFIVQTSSRLDAQEEVHIDLARFSIFVETSADEIKLTCNDGCAWKQLSFRINME